MSQWDYYLYRGAYHGAHAGTAGEDNSPKPEGGKGRETITLCAVKGPSSSLRFGFIHSTSKVEDVRLATIDY